MKSHPILTLVALTLMFVLLIGGQTAIAEKQVKSADSKATTASCPEAKQCPPGACAPGACTPGACATKSAKCGGHKDKATCGGAKAKATCGSTKAGCSAVGSKCCPDDQWEACCPSGSAKAAGTKDAGNSVKSRLL